MNKRIFFRKILNSKDFFMVFAKHLDEIFPLGWHEQDEYGDIWVVHTSTQGWYKALKTTCIEFNIGDCIKWYDSLDWDYSDYIDDNIACLLEAIVFDENGNRLR